MSEENIRYIRPRENMKKLFNEAEDNSLILYFCASYTCVSQAGEGLAEFVNTINLPEYSRKIKQLIVVDTCCLYRNVIPEFSKYSDTTLQTPWEENNKKALSNIKCNHIIEHWCDKIDKQEFKDWLKIVKKDFDGNGNKEDIDIEFHDVVIKEANTYSQKDNSDFKGCVDFILEETAYLCAFLRNSYIFYPGKISEAMEMYAEKHKIGVTYLSYKLSKKYNSELRDSVRFYEKLERSITDFMRYQVSHVNFFIVDKHGEQIYKNNALDYVIGGQCPKNEEQLRSWENTKRVIETGGEMTVEERYKDKYYLSYKAPLIIDNKIEGVIGLAIDITDKKKKEELESINRGQSIMLERQASFEKLIADAVHDIRSPLISLEMLAEKNSLPEKEYIILRSTIAKIKEVCSVLLFGYKENRKAAYALENHPVSVPLLLMDVVARKFSKIPDSNLKLTCNYDPKDYLAYVSGDQSVMERMLSNLVNNAIEATSNKENKIVDVFMVANGSEVKIVVQDNGKGMPRNMIDKIYDRVHVETTKKDGNGIGLGQILSAIDLYNGTFEIDSKEGVGTRFSISFPRIEVPKYIQNKITLEKGYVVLCLDDDNSMQYVWEKLFYPYKNDLSLMFFTEVKDAEVFINSYEYPEKVFVISDYELRNQDTNGLYFILQHNKRSKSLIVTSINDNKEINEKIECAGINMLPKQFLSNLEINIVSEIA